jgi:16S rRNA (cytosine1402-N4)-methyltransferase
MLEQNPISSSSSGYHQPVMLQECIDGLNIKPDGIYVDVTFGGGGHSRSILNQLGKDGRLIAFDQDAEAQNNVPDDKRFTLVPHNFRFLKNFLKYYQAIPVDGILADLGVSSHQFDEGSRGFSYRFDSDLDMRMDQEQKLTAAMVINSYDEIKLAELFKNYGELHNARKLAFEICNARKMNPILTVGQLRKAIEACTPKKEEYSFLSQVFQSLRIEVNQEIEVLEKFLIQTQEVLKVGGRLVVMSYHSLEDRPVKNYIAKGNIDGVENKDIYGVSHKPFKNIGKAAIASPEELQQNSRARSARLRIAEKI